MSQLAVARSQAIRSANVNKLKDASSDFGIYLVLAFRSGASVALSINSHDSTSKTYGAIPANSAGTPAQMVARHVTPYQGSLET